MNYLRDHWQGKLSLAVSFWVNLVLASAVLAYLERFVLPPFLHGEATVTAAAIVYFVVVRLVVYPWQVVGLLRACDRVVSSSFDRTWAVAAQLVVVISFAATLVAVFSSYHVVAAHQRSFTPADIPSIKIDYSLDLVADGSLIHLRGSLDVGVTRAVTELLDVSPRVIGIVLDSGGGRIYEGRGLAMVIQQRKLDTYTLAHCLSACATAFIGGSIRTLGVNAKLGFHQYKTYSLAPNIDVTAEQEKDASLFRRQGIHPEFLERIFSTAHDEMWWPSTDELLRAGVIHRFGFSLPAE